MEKVEKIISLISKYRERTLSQKEQNELELWVAESEENRSLFTELTDEVSMAGKLKAYSEVNSEAIWEKTLQQISPAAKVRPLNPVHRVWWKYAAAAAVVLGVSVAGWLYFQPVADQPVAEKQPAGATRESLAGIVSGGSKATLTLSDGKKIDLDNINGQEKIEQGSVIISAANGQLVYNGANVASGQGPIAVGSVLYNTVTTPMGGQFQVILPDGSIVWLNAASSLRFPIAFAGGERNVSLTGEAFFQVAHMANKPFKVAIETPQGNEGTVEVLGTQFNIHAYTEDVLAKTTLLEGSVKLTTKTAVQRVLKPGQEALVNRNGKIEDVKLVNMANAVPWRNGYISLETDIKTVMQEIARWYNLRIEYAGKLPVKSLQGQISRTYPITDVLTILKKYGIEVTLNSKERKITVM